MILDNVRAKLLEHRGKGRRNRRRGHEGLLGAHAHHTVPCSVAHHACLRDVVNWHSSSATAGGTGACRAGTAGCCILIGHKSCISWCTVISCTLIGLLGFCANLTAGTYTTACTPFLYLHGGAKNKIKKCNKKKKIK